MWTPKARPSSQSFGVWNDTLELWLCDLSTGKPKEFTLSVASEHATNFNAYTPRKKA